MTTFTRDARLYDLLYRDKAYADEAAFVATRLDALGADGRDLLEIGCGTARHALLLAKAGWRVAGIDPSAAMLEQAAVRLAAAPSELARAIALHHADVRDLALDRRFDAAAALFHVIGFLTSDADLTAALETIRRHLNPGAPFLFDFWHAPAILRGGPARRERSVEDDDWHVHRVTEPEWDPASDLVTVRFAIVATDKRSGAVHRSEEVHRMRYFQPDALAERLARTGFEAVECGNWLTGEAPSADRSDVYIAARAV